MNTIGIVDASALIALDAIQELDLLRQLYVKVCVPPAVVQEFGDALPAFLEKVELSLAARRAATSLRQAGLGRGESEVIALGVELRNAEVIIDDRRARREARNRGLSVTGVVGLLLRAKNRGFIPLVRPALDSLRARGFRISETLYQQALAVAGELQE